MAQADQYSSHQLTYHPGVSGVSVTSYYRGFCKCFASVSLYDDYKCTYQLLSLHSPRLLLLPVHHQLPSVAGTSCWKSKEYK